MVHLMQRRKSPGDLIMSTVMDSRRFPRILAVMTAVIVAVHAATLVFEYGFGHDNLMGLRQLFDLDGERNVPAVFSTGILLWASALLCLIAARQKPGARAQAFLWAGLSLVFLYLAADEGFEIHERISKLVAGKGTPSELSVYSWETPYSICLVALGAFYSRFFFKLPRPTRIRFLTAALIYISGALGMEYVAARFVERYHTEQVLAYHVLAAIEETLEMVGTIWFIRALLMYIELEPGLRRVSATADRAIISTQ
jgi:hypothetical protein